MQLLGSFDYGAIMRPGFEQSVFHLRTDQGLVIDYGFWVVSGNRWGFHYPVARPWYEVVARRGAQVGRILGAVTDVGHWLILD